MPAQEIRPVPLSDFLGRISASLSTMIEFLWSVAPTIFISAFVLGFIVAIIGGITGSKTIKGSGVSVVLVSLLAYGLVMATPLIFGVLSSFTASGR